MNQWENALSDLYEVAGLLDIPEEYIVIIKHHRRSLSVSLPVRMDDGRVEVFQGFRVQHSLDRGPAKGGLR